MLMVSLRKHLALWAVVSVISLPCLVLADSSASNSSSQAKDANFQSQIKALETASQVRIGIDAINTDNQQHLQYRADEPFPLQSTAKVIIAAGILKQSAQDNSLLKNKITYTKADLVSWSPMTQENLKEGMTIAALCKAAITQSDNTAANLLVKQLGGPAAVTAFARSIGDTSFRLDHLEPNLNANPSDPADSSTPAAMAQSLKELVFGSHLPALHQALLVTWMKGNQVGEHRIRAGVPADWIVADKTGTGDYGITHDVGVVWPPNCAPLVMAIYVMGSEKKAATQEAVIAKVTDLIIKQFSANDACIKKSLST